MSKSPVGLTLGELRQMLADIPASMDDHVVVVAQDAEGNGFDTMLDVCVGWYRNQHDKEFRGTSRNDDETWLEAEARFTQEYETDEYDEDSRVPVDEHDHPAICFWP